ncbi:MAG TPA: MFS transporter [Rhizomicrobium sp.]|nr:MFS transporter [Rhizomicrobium sp.]
MSTVSIPDNLVVSGEHVAALRAKPLGIGFKTAYGVGQTVDSVSTVVLNTFLFFYVTTVCGLSGSLTGIALFLALGIDAIADPVVGSISDNLSTRWGRRLPLMAISLLPIAVSMGLLFSVPHFASQMALFCYVLACLTSLRVSLSGFIIPNYGLGAELSDDYDERSSIVAFRAIFGIVTTLVGFVLGFKLFLRGPNGLLNRAAYAPFGWTAGVLMLAGGALCIYASLSALPRLLEPVRSQHGLLRRFLGEVVEVFRNPSFRYLFAGVLIFFVGQGVFLTLSLHAYKYFWGLNVATIQLVSIDNVLGLALGLPLAFLLIGRVEKKSVVITGIVVVCLCETLPAFLNLMGFTLGNAQAARDILLVAMLIGGMFTTLVAIAFQSAMADAVDEHEALFAARREGLYFASLSFANKAALGLGSLVSGILLDAIHFPGAAIAAGRHVAIGKGILHALGIAYGPGAALITVVSVLCFSFYRLNRAEHTAIRARLGR